MPESFTVQLPSEAVIRFRRGAGAVPAASVFALLVNPTNPSATDTALPEIREAARALGLQIAVLNASTSREIEAAFATLVRDRDDRIVIWNEGMERLYGWRGDEALGTVSHELLRTKLPQERSEIDELHRRDAGDPQPLRGERRGSDGEGKGGQPTVQNYIDLLTPQFIRTYGNGIEISLVTALVGGIFGKDADAKKARSYFHGEAKKTFIGEPYERSMAYIYRGILYWMDGEPDNARACFRTAQLEDSGTQDEQFSADYAILERARLQAQKKLPQDVALQKLDEAELQIKVPDPQLVRRFGIAACAREYGITPQAMSLRVQKIEAGSADR